MPVTGGLLPGVQVVLSVLLAVAAVVDFRHRKIPNVISLGGCAAGLALWGWHAGVSGMASSMLGLLIGAGLFFPFYIVRGMGAGDIKLMGAVGAFLGPYHIIAAAITVALVGGVIAAWAAFRQGRLKSALRDSWLVAIRARPAITLDRAGREQSIPYGLAISAGVLFYLVMVTFV